MDEHCVRKPEQTMISAEEALDIVLRVAQRLPPVTLPLHEALGKILAEDIRAPDPLPPYPASVKDGYAVVALDGHGEYPIIVESRAGNDGVGVTITPGTVAYVTTGGKSIIFNLYTCWETISVVDIWVMRGCDGAKVDGSALVLWGGTMMEGDWVLQGKGKGDCGVGSGAFGGWVTLEWISDVAAVMVVAMVVEVSVGQGGRRSCRGAMDGDLLAQCSCGCRGSGHGGGGFCWAVKGESGRPGRWAKKMK
ncbi:unnamed protein product [Ilex paraguariensis]|uniref:Molybdopterin biosynthesis protein CNX1 n=1 Tax=Ilex paraguariensis TaxID=185542 RepID=A0ABC8V6B0_9AQUA